MLKVAAAGRASQRAEKRYMEKQAYRFPLGMEKKIKALKKDGQAVLFGYVIK